MATLRIRKVKARGPVRNRDPTGSQAEDPSVRALGRGPGAGGVAPGGAGPRAGAGLAFRGGASLQAQTWRCGRALHLHPAFGLPSCGSDAPPAASAARAAASGGTHGRYHHLPARLEPSARPGPSPGGGECVGPQPGNHRSESCGPLAWVPGLSRLPSPRWVGPIPLTPQPPDALAPTVEARDTRSCGLGIRTPPPTPHHLVGPQTH